MQDIPIEALTRVLQRAVESPDVPGIVAAIRAGDQPVWLGAAGISDLDARTPITPSARLYIYSLTKTALAMLSLRLMEGGTLALDDPLARWLPDAPFAERVTLRQLLSHTAGMPDYGGLASYQDAVRDHPGEPWTFAQYLAETCGDGLLFEPGDGWRYSNIGFMLARRVIEVVTGSSFAEAMHTEILEPLQMTDSFVAADLADTATLSPGYTSLYSEDESLTDMSRRYHPGWVSHGVIVSTVADTSRMYHRLFGGALIGDAALAEMRTLASVPGEHPPAVQPSYGLGVIADPASPYGPMYGHGGGGPGYAAFACHLADLGGQPVTAVVLCNSDRGNAWATTYRLLDLLAEAAADSGRT